MDDGFYDWRLRAVYRMYSVYNAYGRYIMHIVEMGEDEYP